MRATLNILMSRFKDNRPGYRNKHLKSLANTAEIIAPEDQEQFLKHLPKKRKSVAVNTVSKLDNYLRFLQKHCAQSECLKGEELMFVNSIGSRFLPPNSELLKRICGGLFEAGITPVYYRLKRKLYLQYEIPAVK